MALMSNPSREGGFTPHPKCTAGRKVVAVVGILYSTSKAGNRVAMPHMVCLEDLEGKGEEGHDVWDNLVLTANAVWRIDAIAKAAGQQQEFDAEDEAKLLEVLTQSPFEITLRDEVWEGETRARPSGKTDGGFRAFTGEAKPEWEGTMREAEERHQSMVAAIAKKRGGGGAEADNGSRSRWGAKPNGTAKTAAPADAAPTEQDFSDEDLPF